MSICLDKNSAEIAMAARAKIRRQRRHITSNNSTESFLENGFLNVSALSKKEAGASQKTYTEDSSPEDFNENCYLIEVKSNGERVVFSPTGKIFYFLNNN